MPQLRNQEWLDERLAYWQRILRLQDWRITAEFADARIMEGKSGLTWFGATSKEARVRILPPSEWQSPSMRYGVWDEELFLIHELVHLHLTHWRDADSATEPTNPNLDWEAKEQAIDLLATALFSLGGEST